LHNIIQDPPFSRIDLVSCRNLLIYMGSELQKQVIPIFHYALRPGGFLFLGLSENVSQHTDLFTPLDKKNRIFRRLDQLSAAVPLPMFLSARQGRIQASLESVALREPTSLRHSIDSYVLDHLAPPHVVVDRAGNLVHASARTGRYLELAAGQPARYLLPMARKGLRLELRGALSEAMETMRPVTRHRIEVEVDDRLLQINLQVRPLSAPGREPYFLIAFEDLGPPQTKEAETMDDGVADAGIQHLERELRDSRERLQSMMEEYETSLEETKSTNEELVSLNEELQSTNEELETSKEEIQSVNEELQTVNVELQAKVMELDSANGDLQNLFTSTRIAIVFLGRDLKIRTFTPEVTNIFKLIPSDRGRPLTDIACHLPLPGLREDIQSVLNGGIPVEQRVDNGENARYLMRILPYKSPASGIEGVLVTFVDVAPIVRAEGHLRMLVNELNHRVRNMLTVVMALARQTARRTKEPGDFVEVFTGRLQAMAKAYDVVSSEQWSDVDLAALINGQISPHAAGNNSFTVSGPAVRVKPKAALALGMVMHEMTTNAVKHGALSVTGGRVAISWAFEGADAPHDLVVRWQESGGPAVSTPNRRGFGATLIERELQFELNGDAAIQFALGGLAATFRIPLDPEVVEAGKSRGRNEKGP
jgi:two-component system CheB/CheR fusion protein